MLVRIKWQYGEIEEREMDRVPIKDEVIWTEGNESLQYVREVHWRTDGGASLLMGKQD